MEFSATYASVLRVHLLHRTPHRRVPVRTRNCSRFDDSHVLDRKVTTAMRCFTCLMVCCLLLPISVFGETPSETPALQPISGDSAEPDSLVEPQGNASNGNNGSNTSGNSGNGSTANSGPGALAATGYVFPSSGQVFRHWVWSIVGPRTLVPSGLRATWNTWVEDTPKEWEENASGWGKRFGAAVADNAMNQTALTLLSSAMHQDHQYYRCPCSGTWSRTRHAIKMSFMSRNHSGDTVFAPPKIVSRWVGPMVTRNTIYPGRYNSGDAAVAGATYLAGSVAWNVLREFFLKSPAW